MRLASKRHWHKVHEKPFSPVRSEAASTKGDATADDEREATTESVVKLVKDDPATKAKQPLFLWGKT